MGSNENRHFDKNIPEWGSKARKEIAHQQKHHMDDLAIEDSQASNSVEDNLRRLGRDDLADELAEANWQELNKPKKHKKDTKRWCKGKVGREHNYEYVPRRVFLFASWKEYVCTGCGRREWKRTQEQDV